MLSFPRFRRKASSMSQDDQLHLATAHGFVKRKEWLDAFHALDRMSPELKTAPEVLALKVSIFHGLEKWEAMEIVSRRLANAFPDELQWMIAWIASKRRVDGDQKADAILSDYIQVLPPHGETLYALGEFAFSMSDHRTANALLSRAFEILPRLRLRALDDTDLDKFWEAT
jgi:hypothetical protein